MKHRNPAPTDRQSPYRSLGASQFGNAGTFFVAALALPSIFLSCLRG